MRVVKSGKVANKDKIIPDMSKVLYEEGVRWLTKVCQVAWKLEKATKAWQTSVTISIYKNVDRNKCKNYREISHLNFREKVYANALKVNAEKIWNQRWKMAYILFIQVKFAFGQICILRQIFEKFLGVSKECLFLHC